MAGHIFLISCLLAICIPIVFVQLSRSKTVEEMRAENEAETRSKRLRRRPQPPSGKVLRRLTRPRSKTDIYTTNAQSEQERVNPSQIKQTATRGRWDESDSRSGFRADACTDSGALSKEEELRKARAGKPWNGPFRRQLARTETVRKSPVAQWDATTDAPLPRKTGQEMEARGVAVRLFPPDPVPEDNMEEYNQYSQVPSRPPQISQEALHQEASPKNPLQSHNTRPGESSHLQKTEPSPTQSVPQQQTKVESLLLPLDGVQQHHMCDHTCNYHLPQSLEPVTPDGTPRNTSKQAHKACNKAPKPGLPLWQVLLITMGFIIFVFAFAILVAHCLAWFIVYKTEARLGEARSGLLRGGEMKLCLCGKG